MTIRPGEFWVADIPFTDGSGSKKRPILVLWLDGPDVVAALEQLLLIARIGTISATDGQAVKQVWASFVKPQF
jgi:mRNA interferase MazF